MKIHLIKHLLYLLLMLTQVGSIFTQTYLMDGSPITNCSGFFQDSGGTGSYGIAENFSTTICSDLTFGTNIKLTFYGIDLGEGDLLRIYDANTANPAFLINDPFPSTPTNIFAIQASAINPSGCLTLVFSSDQMDEGNQGWSAVIDCVANCQTIQAIANTLPEVMPIDTGWVDICLGEMVSFSGSGNYPQNNLLYSHGDESSLFEWSFGDGSTGFGPNKNHLYQEPGGYIVQLKITDQFGCTSTNYITQRVRVAASSQLVIDDSLPDSICSGEVFVITTGTNTANSTNIDIITNEWSITQAQAISTPYLLPDGTGGVYEESISISQAPFGDTISNMEEILHIAVSMEHSYSGDLDIEISCPNDSSVFLLDYPSGLGSTNFGEPYTPGPFVPDNTCVGIPYTYYFVNEAANGSLVEFDNMAPSYTYTTVKCSEDPMSYTHQDTYFPAGEYEPQQSFDNLIGCPLNGDWSIRIQDNLNQNNGWITGWRIAFADSLFPNKETFSNEIVESGWEEAPSIISFNADTLIVSPMEAGTVAYNFWAVDNFGCLSEASLEFEVLNPDYPSCLTFISDKPDVFSFNISPNPVRSVLYLEIKGVEQVTTSEINVFSALGERIKTTSIANNQTYFEIDFSHLIPGVYYVQLHGDGLISKLKKVVKM